MLRLKEDVTSVLLETNIGRLTWETIYDLTRSTAKEEERKKREDKEQLLILPHTEREDKLYTSKLLSCKTN